MKKQHTWSDYENMFRWIREHNDKHFGRCAACGNWADTEHQHTEGSVEKLCYKCRRWLSGVMLHYIFGTSKCNRISESGHEQRVQP